MSNSPSIIIEQLRIIGVEKNYDIDFKEGVNIIWGDLDCGKSSILNLISYGLGASYIDTYKQIEAKARFCQLTAYFNNIKYIFIRNIFNNKEYIRCYKNKVDENMAPMLLAPTLEQIDDAPDGYISFFILDILGLPRAKVKVSPSKIDSTMNRIGFKDILKFIHLKQKHIAADSLLDMNLRSRYIKHKEVLKYLLNIHDEKTSIIKSELADASNEQKSKLREKNNIVKFLKESDFNFDSDIENKLEEYKSLINKINEEEEKLKTDHRKVLSFSNEVENQLKSLIETINYIEKKKPAIKNDIDKYVKLKNTYDKERKSIKLSLDLNNKFKMNISSSISCPLCNQKQEEHENKDQKNIPLEVLNAEKKSLDRKARSLNQIIDDLRNELASLEREEKNTKESLNIIQSEFNTKYAKEVSALIESISLLEKQKVDITSEIKLLNSNKRFLNRIDQINDRLALIESAINKLSVDLKRAEEECLDPEDVVKKLDKIFVSIMLDSGLSDMTDIQINNNLDYIVRNKDYIKHTSGGVRTITSIAIYLSKLFYSMKFDSHLPTLFMLDTPGNNIGRKRDKCNNSEDASDPVIYENIYQRLEDIAIFSEKINTKFQVIVVDNDLAETAKNNPCFYIAKHFNKSDPQFDSGLIYDF